ncbi:uncharacterized protein EV154DRAFT_515630 [Mucor mucedo]|uniref:uncharacterized protein n=1 Tax=Mucor mucedo TaxID=29922 RepID=UPI00221EEC2B|nr:uncharacterized protein EV154DRAFT_515630 [Mucor mucedo]KAI7889172.1 hypothetical protein EV154DRAFT_515630 [Mucor mucedo]
MLELKGITIRHTLFFMYHYDKSNCFFLAFIGVEYTFGNSSFEAIPVLSLTLAMLKKKSSSSFAIFPFKIISYILVWKGCRFVWLCESVSCLIHKTHVTV